MKLVIKLPPLTISPAPQPGWKLPWMTVVLVVFGLLTLAATNAAAHMPALGGFHTVDTAYEVTDVDWSQVVYHEATCDKPRLWFKVPLKKGKELFVQLGAPDMNELQPHRWSLAIVGAGLPAAELPFAVPAGAGAIVRQGKAPTEAAEFYEPFSQTKSWIVHEERWTAPADGTYWLVAWQTQRQASRLWLSVGEEEKFNGVDTGALMKAMVKIKAFHADPVAGADATCPVDADPELAKDSGTPQDATNADVTAADGGCTASGPSGTSTPATFGLILLALAAIGARRSSTMERGS